MVAIMFPAIAGGAVRALEMSVRDAEEISAPQVVPWIKPSCRRAAGEGDPVSTSAQRLKTHFIGAEHADRVEKVKDMAWRSS